MDRYNGVVWWAGKGLAAMILVLALFFSQPTACRAQSETARVSVPSSLAFYVTDIRMTTSGTPDLFVLNFTDLHLTSGHGLRVSVKASNATLTSSGGTGISSSLVSWSIRNAAGGTGSNGTLSASAFTQVFQGAANASSGSVGLAWSLAAPGTGVHAGLQSVTLTWKLESVGL